MAFDITEILSEKNEVHQLHIKGATDHNEATSCAQDWCEKNNCILQTVIIQEQHGEPVIFIASVCSDDYE